MTLFSPTLLVAPGPALLSVGTDTGAVGAAWPDGRGRELSRDPPSLLSGWGTWGARGVWGTARLRGRGEATRGPPGPCSISVPARIC